jgi:hypothetical protein
MEMHGMTIHFGRRGSIPQHGARAIVGEAKTGNSMPRLANGSAVRAMSSCARIIAARLIGIQVPSLG